MAQTLYDSKTNQYTNPAFAAPNAPGTLINTDVAGVPNNPTAITGNSLQGGQLLSLPTPTPNLTPVAGITGTTDQQIENAIAQQQKDAQAKTDTSQSDVSSTLNQILGIQQSRGGLEDQANIPQLNQLSNNTFSALQASKRAQETELKNLQDNAGLYSAQQQQAKQGEINRKYAFEQADLSIAYDVANRNLTGAQATVDRKIQLALEPLQTKIQYQESVLSRNEGRLDKATENKLSLLIDKNKRELDQKDKQLNNTYDLWKTAGENGAPVDVLTKANTLITQGKTLEAQNLLALYQENPLDKQYKEAQIANLNSQINERNNPVGVQTLTGKPQTASQASANGYADRVNEANLTISQLGSKFTGRYALGAYLPNSLQSGDRQAYEQAKRNFVTAVLRRESGAAIAPSEFDTAEKQYFPQPGDKPSTVAQKEISRNTAINNLYREANVLRPVLPGQIIEANGKKYRVGSDGETLEEIK